MSERKLRHFNRKQGRELASCEAPEDIVRSDAMDEVSLSPSSTLDTRKKNPKRRWKQKIANKANSFDSDRLDFIPWKQAESSGDPFALLSGGVEGGFLSLEEIDESEYCLFSGSPDIESEEKAENTTSSKLKKRKRVNVDAESEGGDSCVVNEEGIKEKGSKKKKRRRKKRSNDHKTKELIPDGEPEQQCEPAEGSPKDSNKTNAESGTDEEPFGDDGMCAWNELRLHPLLIKSMRRLGFIKPTPIQKACIPVAAHHGKDVIGAAQTGSGKTLAFGLPILQRLLEEREKARRLLENGTGGTGGFGESHLRALILAPTRELALQVSDHLKIAAKYINVRVVSIVGGMYSEKQERLLRRRPEIVVGTPGRLWELMSGGNEHLVELHSLSFFVLDEADRMIENGHFNELQSIIDMLPTGNSNMEQTSETNKTYKTIPNLPRKKRQTFVFSATVALSDNFRKKLKRTLSSTKSTLTDGLTSIEKLSERAGMRPDVAIIDLTNTSIVADKLVESFIECGEDEKDAHLYYILSVHRKGRTIVFCTSIAALRHISSLLRLLDVNAWTLHAQMQQRARLKAMDRFRESEHGVLIATDVAARGLDIPGIRTVVHYQLPHSAEVYIHRSGRTARSSFDGCSIALISSSDKAKFSSLCKSLSKESLQEFCVDYAYMPDVVKRISLARRIDKIQQKISQESAEKSWFQRNAANVELAVDDTDSEEEREMVYKQKKTSFFHLKQLQQGLIALLSRPMQPKAFSHRFLAATGVSPLVQQQLEEFSKAKLMGKMGSQEKKTRGLLVIGQDCVEPLQALRSSGREVCVNVDKKRETRRLVENWKSKRREEKKREREQRRKARKKARQGMK
ncbi:DEAD-box ATP-dependent RNA helicase 13 isoform X2 [Dendrobium catenatum]|uniref:DEAD-box ATP-dependent RNA helicase 13 isoform X2 n=1 Tax=Dendrobium catenatum TaxID=906689 RepID=UPI0009F4C288|nr:DEAD-box ATP-dependent RNA helicase 13 isoform X2 [Dendrobium catenatum]